MLVCTSRAEVSRKSLGKPARDLLVLRRVRVHAGKCGMPPRSHADAMRLARQRLCLSRPFRVALLEERKVKQPLARVIDDVSLMRFVDCGQTRFSTRSRTCAS
jgi:hypothetical protein